MGGETTEISGTTTSVLVEAAHWDAVSMFRTGRRHKITSEAGKRNERGVDPTICEAAADRVVELLVEHGGGTAHPGVTVVGTPPAMPVVEVAGDLAARVSGMPITEDAVGRVPRARSAARCDRVRHACRSPRPRGAPTSPTPRTSPRRSSGSSATTRCRRCCPTPPSGRGLTRPQQLRRRIGRTLAGEGFVEVVTFPFVGEADLDALGLTAEDPRRDLLRLSNPLNAEAGFMTTTLLPGPAARGRHERRARHHATSRSSRPAPSRSRATPARRRSCRSTGARPRPSSRPSTPRCPPSRSTSRWSAPVTRCPAAGGARPGPSRGPTPSRPYEPSPASLGLEVSASAVELAPWHPGRCAELTVDGEVVGHAGEVHPTVCQAFGLPKRTVAAEVDLDLLIARAVHLRTAPTFSSYPVAKEDVALVVDAAVPAADVEAALREGAGELLESIRLFDVYTGDQVGEGKKSLAFALRFRAPDRTLKEGEAAAARDAAVALAAERTGAVQRA